MTVPSPCISICQLDKVAGWCTGCKRTLEEIRAWKTASDQRKLEILEACKARETVEA